MQPGLGPDVSEQISEIFRAEHGSPEHVRAAFSADGRYLLANWESTGVSHLDVWEL